MTPPIRSFLIFVVSILLAGSASGQVDDFCTEFGATPSLDSPFANVPYLYGRITLKGFDPAAKSPKVTITLLDSQQTQRRLSIGLVEPKQSQKSPVVEKTGNYCFRRSSGSSAILILDVDAVEVARRSVGTFGAAQQRQDFEIYAQQQHKVLPPAAISVKFVYPPNDKTAELYKKAADAEQGNDTGKTIKLLKEIVVVDPNDFIAWAKLGSLHLLRGELPHAEIALRKSIALKDEYTPAWINVGQIRLAQKQYEAAIEVFKHAAAIDRESARTFQLLGESYLLAKQGSLGAQALNEAIRLDPVGMAECHLQLAHLYQLAGAKGLATREYKLFLGKVADHPDKKKFEKFIRDNPEEPASK
jgi:tetratricopeptide (TPR) repeat protein